MSVSSAWYTHRQSVRAQVVVERGSHLQLLAQHHGVGQVNLQEEVPEDCRPDGLSHTHPRLGRHPHRLHQPRCDRVGKRHRHGATPTRTEAHRTKSVSSSQVSQVDRDGFCDTKRLLMSVCIDILLIMWRHCCHAMKYLNLLKLEDNFTSLCLMFFHKFVHMHSK